MATTSSSLTEERELLIHPIVPESVAHNTKTVSDIRNLTSSLFGIAAGILGLESYVGFLFYILGTTFVSLLMVGLLARGEGGVGRYFKGGLWEILSLEVVGGMSGFILTWTLFLGLVRM
ncbi:Rab5-interacting protein-domain-containing protein [Peziza echinospora]|nr:Rab5-interacting protein-domain-containing protein [Peziza echinospora]